MSQIAEKISRGWKVDQFEFLASNEIFVHILRCALHKLCNFKLLNIKKLKKASTW